MIKLKNSNFLGIHSIKKSTAIEFDSRMTVLTGFNGSGKSSILLGIFLAIDGLNERKDRGLLTARKNWGVELNLEDNDFTPNNSNKIYNFLIPKTNIDLKFRNIILDSQNIEIMQKVTQVFGENMHKSFEESFNSTIELCKVEEKNVKNNTFSNYTSKERVKENTEIFSFLIAAKNQQGHIDVTSEYGEKLKNKKIEISAALYQDEKFFYTENLEGINGLKNLDVFTENNNLDKSIYFLLNEFRKKILKSNTDLPKRLAEEVKKNSGKNVDFYNIFKEIIETKKFNSDVYDFLSKVNEFYKELNKNVYISDAGDIYFKEFNKAKKTLKIINWYDCSKGEKNLLSLLLITFIYKDSNTIFILDEPDLAMHINWQKKLLRTFLEIAPKSQFIVSTHSPALIPQDTKEINFVNVTKLKEEMEMYSE
ncbi:TPA: AAA family ATPase [Acinetobacter baumannii]|nr:AAA family ATPase [Acinetobacter baumannii]HCJ0884370.1 AAA family ATPase [Acinetobacter baumannii]HDJ7843325.1 AAA family ATPase [Acinetobacter baumannii]HDK8949256.1 AAA family ATPase [Acinetobacter baumannii]